RGQSTRHRRDTPRAAVLSRYTPRCRNRRDAGDRRGKRERQSCAARAVPDRSAGGSARGRQEYMVTARQRTLIESSWERMRPLAAHVADLFYDRLFELDPSLEDVFPEELAALRPRFMQAVGAAVAGLGELDATRAALDLGRRSLSRGIRPGH